MVYLQGYEGSVSKCTTFLAKSRRILVLAGCNGTRPKFAQCCRVAWRIVSRELQNLIHFGFSTFSQLQHQHKCANLGTHTISCLARTIENAHFLCRSAILLSMRHVSLWGFWRSGYPRRRENFSTVNSRNSYIGSFTEPPTIVSRPIGNQRQSTFCSPIVYPTINRAVVLLLRYQITSMIKFYCQIFFSNCTSKTVFPQKNTNSRLRPLNQRFDDNNLQSLGNLQK